MSVACKPSRFEPRPLLASAHRVLAVVALLALMTAGTGTAVGEDGAVAENPGAEPPAAASPPRISVDGLEDIFALWSERAGVIAKAPDNRAELVRIERNLVAARRDLGIEQLQIFAAELTREGFHELANKHLMQAKYLFDLALELDASFADAYYGQARAMLSQSVFSTPSALLTAVHGLIASAANFWRGFTLLGRAYLAVILALFLTLSGVTIFLMLKYNALVRHDISELLPTAVPEIIRNQLGWLLIALPIFLPFGVLGALLIWVALAWVYVEKNERVVVILALALLLFSYPVLRVANMFLASYSSRPLQALVATYHGGYHPHTIKVLSEIVEKNPDDTLVRFVLALSAKKAGRFQEALGHWQQLTQQMPSDERVFVNLGNVYFALNDDANAERAYKSALELNSSSVLANYNLTKVYLKRFDFAKAKEILEIATAIDKYAIRRFAAQDGGAQSASKSVIDAELAPGDLWWRAVHEAWTGSVSGSAEAGTATAAGDFFVPNLELWNVGAWGASQRATPIVVIAALAGIWVLASLRKRFGHARQCLMCGRSTCPRCQRVAESERYCSHCMQLFVKREGIEPEARAAKLKEIELFETRLSWLCRLASLVLPGASRILRGHSLSGTAIVFFWALILVAAFGHGHMPHAPYAALGVQEPVWPTIGGTAAALYYVVVQLATFRGNR